MFLLEIQTIVGCSMLDKLVELCKNDLVSTNDLKLNLNGLNYCKLPIHWDLTTTFTMREIFPKCPILMYLHFQSLVNVNLDLMVYGKRVMTNAKTVRYNEIEHFP